MKEIDDTLQKLIGAIEHVAPKTWDLLVRAHRVSYLTDATTSAFWAIALFSFALWNWRMFKAWFKKDGSSHQIDLPDVTWVTVIVLSVFVGSVFLTDAVSNAVMYLNADAFTAKELLQSVRR